jgi:hypothetical protein
MPAMRVPSRAILRNQANVGLSANVSGSPAAKRNSVSKCVEVPTCSSAKNKAPFDARTGSPSTEIWVQRYSSSPARHHRRRRRPWPGDGLLPGQGIHGHHQCRGAGEGLSAAAMSGATPRSSAPTTCCPATSPSTNSMKLWEGLEQDLNYNAMVSQRGVLNLIHSDAQRDAFVRRGNAMRLHGIDAELLDREGCARCMPFLDFDNARFPIKGGLLQRRGGTARHDAVAWGYARGADHRGVDIIQNCEVTGIGARTAGHRRRDHARLHRRGRSAWRWPGNPRKVAAMAGMRCRSKAMCCRPSSPRAEAGDRRCHHLRRRAFLCQPVRQGRPGLRRRHRRLQFLCPTRQPAGGRGRDARAAWR